MHDKTLNKYLNEAIRLKAEIEALKADFEACKGKITGELVERGINEYRHGDRKVKYTVFSKKSFDKKSFEKAYPDLAEAYTTVKESTRFTIQEG